MSDLFLTPVDMDEQDNEAELIIPTSFEDALSYAEQLIYLYLNKQDKLVEGDNITLTENPDGTVTISATGTEGHDGVGIVSITGTITETGTNVTVLLTDGRTQTFFVERGEKGDKGDTGERGADGTDGADGVSPVVTVVPIPGGHRVEIATPSGTPTFDVMDGTDGQDGAPGAPGQPGQDGVSPTVTVTPITGGNRVSITSVSGTSTFDVMNGTDGRDGTDGTDGTDGVSPTVTVRSITGGHQIEIVSAGGTERFDVMDGVNGTNGTDGISPTVTVTTITGGHQIEIVSAGGTERFDVMDGVNGTNGTDGVGIVSITYDSTDSSGNNIYDVNMSDGTTYNITAPRGPAGTSGIPTGGTPHTVLTRAYENLEVYKWSSPAYAINFNISQAPTTILGTVVSFVFRKRTALYVCSPVLTGGVQYVAIEDYSSSKNGSTLNSAIVWKTATAGQLPNTFNGSLTTSEISAIRSVTLVYPTRLRYTFSTVIVLNSSGNVVGVGTGYATAYITDASTGTYAINVAINMITNTVANEEYTILLGM